MDKDKDNFEYRLGKEDIYMLCHTCIIDQNMDSEGLCHLVKRDEKLGKH